MLQRMLCPSCGEELEVKYTPSMEYYRITEDGKFERQDENDLSNLEIICPYDEGNDEHQTTDCEWKKEVIKQFHRQVLSGDE